MEFAFLHPGPVGLVFAAAAVVAGAPWFSDGLRAFRLRRGLRRLAPARLADAPTGLVHVIGRVALDTPLFAPLSARPCAGFRLEVASIGGGPVRTVHETRPFRLTADGGVARITGAQPAWEFAATAEREIAPGDRISEGLTVLLARVPEALWWRRSGGTLRLVERALVAEATCHVVGWSRQARPLELPAEIELQRTGTDDAVPMAASRRAFDEVDVWIDAGEPLDFLLLGDRAPDVTRHVPPAWRLAGLVLGPLLSLGGLLWLAHAADQLRALGRF